jgi:exodeoxyribonuclease VII large subunit
LDSITKTVTDLGLFYIKGQLIDPHVLINPISHVHSFYASLRDEKEECKINIKMYDVLKLKKEFKFKDGDLVIIKSRPSIIKKRGELYLQIFDIELVGTGDLLKKIEELKIQLRNEGLFNLAHKKQLPLFPKKVGLITGKNSEGIKDVKINTLRRWP